MARVVLITNDSTHGQRLVQAIHERGIVIDAVLYLTGSLRLPARRGLGMGGRVLRWPLWAGRTLRRKARFHRERRAKYAARCARVVDAGGVNGPRLLRHLRELAPDWIVLGGGGIVGAEVIASARLGVLNAHAALLPWIRGCGGVGASLEHGVALGATLHFVDRGIDTGAIIQRRIAPFGPDDTDLGRLEVACDELASEMMADAVEGIVRRGVIPRGVGQDEKHPLFRWPDPEGTRRRQALAATGRAHALHQAWRPLCVDDERGILPAEAFAPPSVTAMPRS